MSANNDYQPTGWAMLILEIATASIITFGIWLVAPNNLAVWAWGFLVGVLLLQGLLESLLPENYGDQ